MKIGFIGLGIMGESMSENIVKKHDDTVYVFDFVKEKVELLVSKGAVACETSVELAEKSDVIISMVRSRSIPGQCIQKFWMRWMRQRPV